MKKQIIFFFIVILFQNNLCYSKKIYCSQDSAYFLTQYYPKINEIELLLLKNSYSKALALYKELYKTNDGLFFSRDLYNAFVCATKAYDFDFGYLTIQKLSAIGFDLNSIKENKNFAQYFSSEKGKKSIENIKKDHNIFMSSVDIEYRDELNKMFDLDQKFRKMTKDDKKNYNDTITKIDKVNGHKLLGFIKERGFPSEVKVGISGKIESMQNFWAIVLHQAAYSDYEIRHEYIEILKKAALNGEMDPHLYAFIEERFSGSGKYKTNSFLKVICTDSIECSKELAIKDKIGKWVYRQYDEQQNIKIEKNRKKIGLESLFDFQKKVYFDMNVKSDFYFGYLGGVSIYTGCNIGGAKALLKNTKVMEL